MTDKLKSRQELLNETKALRARLEEAEETIRAIHSGEVDAFVVAQSEKTHTLMLKGADYPYRAMVDSMGEGAVTLIPDGTIFFCNSRFTKIVQIPFEKLIGSPFQSLIPPEEQSKFWDMVRESGQNTVRGEFRLQTVNGTHVPVQLSAHILETEDVHGITIVVTDLTDRKLAEQARWEAEHKLAKMLQSMVDGTVVVDLSGKITFANPAAERILEIPKEKIIGIDYYSSVLKQIDANRNVYPLDQLPLAIALRERGEVNAIEHSILTTSGEIKWLSVNASPLLDENGQLYGAIASFRDVTEQKKNAEALRELHERNALQASLLDQVRNAVIATDLDGKIFYWNKYAQSLYQWKAEEVIGRPIQEVNVPEDEIGLSDKIIDSIQQVGYWEGEFIVSRKDGSLFPAEVVDTLIKNTEGRVTGILGVSIDITERKRAEQELIASETRYRRLFEASQDGVILLDADTGEIFDVNPYLVKMLGYSFEEFLGKKLWDIGAFKDVATSQLAFSELQKNDYVRYEDLPLRSKDGQLKNVEFVSNVYLSDRKKIIQCNVRDITERKRAEETMRRSRDLLDLTGQIANIGGWELDLETQVLNWTEEVYRIHEVDPATQLDVAEAINFYSPEARPVIRAAVQAGIDSGTAWDLELPVITAQGRHIWVRAQGAAERRGSKTVRLHGAFQDITDRKLAEEEIRTRAKELEMLYRLSRSLADATNLNQVFDIVNRYGVDNVHVTFSRIGLLEGGNLVIRAGYSLRDLDHNLFVGDSKPIQALPYCQRVLKGHKAIVLHASNPKVGSEERKALLLDQVRSICLVPLRVGKTKADSGRLLGMLMLGEARDENREPFTPQKLSLIGGIGDQASSVIRRMLLREETDRRLRHLSALSEIDHAITSGVNLNTSLTTVLEQVVGQLKVDATDILLLDSSSQTLVFFCGQGFRTKALESTRLRLGESHAGRAAMDRMLIHVSNLQNPIDVLITPRLAKEDFVEYFGAPLIAKGQVKGVLEVFNRRSLKPNDEWLGFLKALAEQASIAIDNAMLVDSLTRSNVELTLAYTDTIEGWSRALDLRDKETEGHTLRVTEKTQLLARSFGLRDDELVQIRWGSLLHDIGKMGVPDNILLKPGSLTDEEWVLMKKHPTLAYELLSPIHYLRLALDIPYCHHEKWDGTGYPRGLKGEQIPLSARIFAIVDVWDALTSDRPYRPAWSKEKTIDHIKSGSGTHFDPQVVKTFILEMDN